MVNTEFGVPSFDYTLATAGQLIFDVDGRSNQIAEAYNTEFGIPSFHYTLAKAGQLGFDVDGRTTNN